MSVTLDTQAILGESCEEPYEVQINVERERDFEIYRIQVMNR